MSTPRPSAATDPRGLTILLKHHRLLSGSGRHPPNSLSALDEVLHQGAAAIEFDIHAIGDGDYLLVHDHALDRETTGHGPVASMTSAPSKALRLKGWNEPPALLSEVAATLRRCNRPLKVQVDLKHEFPLSQDEARQLLRALEPVRSNARLRVVVGCLADWNLRTLHRLDPSLLLGLDFFLYLDACVDEPRRLPTRVGAYGYLDDHPLAWERRVPAREYLEDRIESLCGLVPNPVEVYLRKEFVRQALADGCNPVETVRRALGAVVVDAWILNADEPQASTQLRALLEAGVDQITTDTALQLPALLSPGRASS